MPDESFDAVIVGGGNKGLCLAIYSDKHDPTWERTAKEIARFSEKDAELWLKLRELDATEELQRVTVDNVHLHLELSLGPDVLERHMAVYPKLLKAGVASDGLILQASPMSTPI